jgi:hypothetical protein
METNGEDPDEQRDDRSVTAFIEHVERLTYESAKIHSEAVLLRGYVYLMSCKSEDAFILEQLIALSDSPLDGKLSIETELLMSAEAMFEGRYDDNELPHIIARNQVLSMLEKISVLSESGQGAAQKRLIQAEMLQQEGIPYASKETLIRLADDYIDGTGVDMSDPDDVICALQSYEEKKRSDLLHTLHERCREMSSDLLLGEYGFKTDHPSVATLVVSLSVHLAAYAQGIDKYDFETHMDGVRSIADELCIDPVEYQVAVAILQRQIDTIFML